MSEHVADIAVLKVKTEVLEKGLETKVSKLEFDPVRKIVYGVVALILVGVGTSAMKIISAIPKIPAG
jgi:hypothetical protein